MRLRSKSLATGARKSDFQNKNKAKGNRDVPGLTEWMVSKKAQKYAHVWTSRFLCTLKWRMLEFFQSLSAACSVTLRKINSKPECPHGWRELAWPSLEHKDLVLGDLDFWKDLAEAREGWCSCRALRAQESPSLGVLKGLSPLHFKRCQCFYVLMCSLTQPASPGTVCCATLSILSQFFSSSLVLLVLQERCGCSSVWYCG